MQRTDLNSTLLDAAGYLDQQALLELEFKSGAIYRYLGVPAATYGELLTAESKGAYFHCHMRNRFPYSKIRGERRTL
jgi:KTSC domain